MVSFPCSRSLSGRPKASGGAPKSEAVSRSALLGEPAGILASVSERTRGAEFRLGDPTKQNGGERRARLGRISGRQAQQRPRDVGRGRRGLGVCRIRIVGARVLGRKKGIGWTRTHKLVRGYVRRNVGWSDILRPGKRDLPNNKQCRRILVNARLVDENSTWQSRAHLRAKGGLASASDRRRTQQRLRWRVAPHRHRLQLPTAGRFANRGHNLL
jgi:hypothetical protein